MCRCEHRCQWRAEEAVGSPGVGVSGSYEPPDLAAGNWTLGPLQEHSMILATEASLQPPVTLDHKIIRTSILQFALLGWKQAGHSGSSFLIFEASLQIWGGCLLLALHTRLVPLGPYFPVFLLHCWPVQVGALAQNWPLKGTFLPSSSCSSFSALQANQRHCWSPFWNNRFYVANWRYRVTGEGDCGSPVIHHRMLSGLC